jgi:predicted MFS family arabinose efflux permease
MKRIEIESKHLAGILSALLILAGIYLMFLYDVPDSEEVTNMWISWLLLIFGIIGVVVSSLWKEKRNPLIESDDNSGV